MSTTVQQETSQTTSDKPEEQSTSITLDSNKESSKPNSHPLLDSDGKLSSAIAATSLKHAKPQDLPSFPSQGGVKLASASTAASLANTNKKEFEHWKPGKLPEANKAALLAKDVDMTDGGSSIMSAANQAVHKKAPDAITERDAPPDDRKKALMAATGAFSEGRRRAGSTPSKPPPSPGTAGWALKAASQSHNTQSSSSTSDFKPGDPGFEASRIQNAKGNVSRDMYGSNPPVGVDLEERKRQDTLKASAIAMARKMYTIQQHQFDEAKSVGRLGTRHETIMSRNRPMSDVSSTTGSEFRGYKYENLEEAARKLAQERLAKIHDEHAEYRQYYYGGQPVTPPKSRLSMRRKTKPTSIDEKDDSDEEQSRRIRSQMSIFQSKLAAVDNKKRQADRDTVLAAAHRNVTAQMNAMDERVFQDTSKMSPQQRELWERQARERAQRDSDYRMTNVGKVHIGGGRYMDQSEVDAIARARVQPTLDEITERAEKQRTRDAEIKAEQDKQKAEAEQEKLRLALEKAKSRELIDKEKLEKKEAKAVDKQKRLEEMRAAKERAREEKEMRKTRERESKAAAASAITSTAAANAAEVQWREPQAAEDRESRDSESDEEESDQESDEDNARELSPSGTPVARAEAPAEEEKKENEDTVVPLPSTLGTTVPKEEATSPAETPIVTNLDDTPASPPKGDSKVKTWFRRLSRSTSKTQPSTSNAETKPIMSETDNAATTDTTEAVTNDKDKDKDKDDDKSEDEWSQPDSMRDVAMAGRTNTHESEDMYGAPENDGPVSPVKETNDAEGRDRSPSISSVSDNDKEAPKSVSVPAPRSNSPMPEPTNLVTEEPETRGRKGFRQRILSKVKSSKDKSKPSTTDPDTTMTTEKDAATTPSAATNGITEHEDHDEARDTFEEEKLGPSSKVNAASPKGGSTERSKFTEDL